MTIKDLPTLNAALNTISAVLLLMGFIAIKRGSRQKHKSLMLSALIVSGLFLTSYLIYHAEVGSVPYPRYDWTRPLYFIILVPHIILAGLMVPFIFMAVWHALKGRYEKHRRIVRWIWPVWMYVSVSGVAVYLMLYRL